MKSFMTLQHKKFLPIHGTFSTARVSRAFVFAVAVLSFTPVVASATALQELTDESLGSVTGEGVALAFDNFSFRMAPTSYIEMTGSTVVNTAATDDAYDRGWRRGDLRYYGLSFTNGSTASGSDWFTAQTAGVVCTPGTDGLGCPLGSTAAPGIKDFASVYNPYVIRVFQNAGYDYQGTCQGSLLLNACSVVTAASPTVYEFIGPSKGDAWRWSFWGQLDVGATGAALAEMGYLQSQSIILGKNSTTDGRSSKLQILQTPTNVAAEQSLSVVYQSRLSGNFRFSLAQKASVATEGRNVVPDFDDVEGLYFKNVDAFLPLGQLNYQTLVFRSAPALNGNFIVELTPIPNIAAVYNSFYCATNTCTSATFNGGKPGSIGAFITTDNVIASPNAETHGYVRWGTTTGNAPTEGSTDTTNGIYFRNAAAAAVSPGVASNIGRARIEGLMIQSMKLTSLGAGT